MTDSRKAMMQVEFRLPSQQKVVGFVITLRYSKQDPLAVEISLPTSATANLYWALATHPFFGSQSSRPYTVSRDLLYDGMFGLEGEGSAVVWPSQQDNDEVVFLGLRNTLGEALLAFPAGALADFLIGTYSLVQRGTEQLDSSWCDLLLERPAA